MVVRARSFSNHGRNAGVADCLFACAPRDSVASGAEANRKRNPECVPVDGAVLSRATTPEDASAAGEMPDVVRGLLGLG